MRSIRRTDMWRTQLMAIILTSTLAMSALANVGATAVQDDPPTLSGSQQALIPIAALAAAGDIERLGDAIDQGLDAGMTISDAREVLVQVYAYAGFPRSLNALGELMRVRDARETRGLHDAPGREPSRQVPTGDALLEAGTDNQTRLTGGPVQGPLFEFAPAIDQYLKSHLFGAIFERDNLDWQTRELATISMLAAIHGTDAQLKAHIGFSLNVGVSQSQLQELIAILDIRYDPAAAQRVRLALESTNALNKADLSK